MAHPFLYSRTGLLPEDFPAVCGLGESYAAPTETDRIARDPRAYQVRHETYGLGYCVRDSTVNDPVPPAPGGGGTIEAAQKLEQARRLGEELNRRFRVIATQAQSSPETLDLPAVRSLAALMRRAGQTMRADLLTQLAATIEQRRATTSPIPIGPIGDAPTQGGPTEQGGATTPATPSMLQQVLTAAVLTSPAWGVLIATYPWRRGARAP